MIIIRTSTTILFLKKNQNYTKLNALYVATKRIKGDKTDTRRKVIQLQTEVNTGSAIVLPKCQVKYSNL